MTEEEIIKKNVDRVDLRLKSLKAAITDEQKKNINNYKLICDGKEYALNEIDFKQSLIFVCKEYFLPYIGYWGMLQLNNIVYPDKSLAGVNSMIKTSYMVADSRDVKYTKIPMESFYEESRDDLLPESWNGINYKTKTCILWRLVSSVGIGDNNKMYDGCYSWIEERLRTGKIDWIFYLGSLKSFEEEYTDVANLGIPIYNMIPKTTSKTKNNSTKLNDNGREDIF